MNKFVHYFLFIIVLCCFVISASVLKTFKGLYKLRFEKNPALQIRTAEQFNENFSYFPNISASAIPIDGLRLAYYLQDPSLRSEVKDLSKKATQANPYLGYSDFVLGRYYYSIGNIDSSTYYSKKAFDLWPKSIDNYKMYNQTLAFKGDTLGILSAYESIEDIFRDRTKYGDMFIKYYTFAKVKYLIKSYPDESFIEYANLKGRWQQIHEYEDGKITYEDSFIEFDTSKNLAKFNNTSYFVAKSNDSLNLFSLSDRNYKITSLLVRFSDSLKTLTIKYDPKSNQPESFFKKVD